MSNPQGTHKSKDVYVTNLRANATTIDVQNPPEIKSAAGQLRFEAGVRIGGSSTAATNTTDVALGKSASATGGNSISINGTSSGADSISIGRLSSASATQSIAIGLSANVATSGCVQIGQAVKYSGGNAIMSFRSQTVSDESWIDTQTGYAKIDGSGNLYKDTTPITSGSASIFRRNRTTTQTIATDTDTTIQFNANDANNTSPPGTWNGTLYQFEVNANGWYEITAGVAYSTDINNKFRVDILINGSVEAGQTQLYSTGTIARSTTVVKAYISSAGAVKVNTTQNTGSSKDLQSAFIIVEKIAGTLALPTFVSLATANLDMACYNIKNVEALDVNSLATKDTGFITVNSPLVMSSTGDKIRFTNGIEIGDASTSTTAASAIAIGKNASASAVNSVAVGVNTQSANVYAVAIGTNPQATHRYSIAIGSGSTSGLASKSLANYAIAIGTRALTTTNSAYSVVIGYRSYAASYSAVAIGYRAQAYAGYSGVAIGFRSSTGAAYTTAVGPRSTAGGAGSISIGAFANNDSTPNQIAIGKNCTTSGKNCIGLGFQTSIHWQAPYSVAIGSRTILYGHDSIVVGNNAQSTLAAIDGIAIGHNAVVTARDQIKLGNPIPTSATATATAWGQTFQDRAWADATTGFAKIDGSGNLYKDTGSLSINGNLDMFCYTISNVMAMHVGHLYGKSPIDVHDNFNIKDTVSGGKITFEAGIEIGNTTTSATNVGGIALALGAGASATGHVSIAIGTNAVASNVRSIAIGTSAHAYGHYDVAINAKTTSAGPGGYSPLGGAVAIGCIYTEGIVHYAQATYYGATALGARAVATKKYSLAISGKAHAYGDFSIAIGSKSNAPNNYSLALGCWARSESNDAVAIGYHSWCIGSYAGVSIGTDSYTYADFGIAIGKSAGVKASATRGIAIGRSAQVFTAVTDGIAIGYNALTKGNDGIAIGRLSYAQQLDNIAIGHGAKSYNGTYCVAIGKQSLSKNYYTTTVGSFSLAAGIRGVSLGSFAAISSTVYVNSVAVGYSAVVNARSSVNIGTFGITWTTGTFSSAVGYNNDAKGTRSVVFGALAYSGASASNSVAIGYNCKSYGLRSISIGNTAKSVLAATDGMAMGASSMANSAGSIAIGKSSSATGANSVALGYSASTSSADDVQLGRNTGSGGAGVMKFHSQTVSSEAWVAAGVKMAVIDASGNMNKDSASTVTLTGTLSIGTNLIVSTITPLTANKVTISGNVEVTGTSFQVGKSYLVTKQTTTTTATPTNVTIIALPATSNYAHFDVFVTAISSSLVVASYNFRDGFVRSDGATASLISPTKTVLYEFNAAYDASVTVSGTNAIVTITGIAATAVTWDIITSVHSKNL